MSVWRGRNVFVTGGAGFLGSHLIQRLVVDGAHVSCLVRGDRPRSGLRLDGVERVHGDIGDLQRLHSILRSRAIEVVFHLAAQPIVGDAKADPFQTLETNVRGTYCLLEALRLWGGVKAAVIMASDKVYLPSEAPPHAETFPLGGALPYEVSKVCADAIAACYARAYNLPIAVARMGNLYGPGDLQWSRIVPGTIRALLQRSSIVLRSDGTPRRDYFYVEDAASALLALCAALLDRQDGVSGGAFNFGTGVPTRVIDLVHMLIAAAGEVGVGVEPTILGNGAHGEIVDQWLDCGKAKRGLHWEYRTALAQGLDKTWAWYENRLHERP